MVEMEKRLRGKLKLTVQSKTVVFFSYCLYNSCLQIVFQLFFLSLPSHAHPSSFTVSFRDANSWASLLRHFWFFFVSPQCPFFSSFSFLLPQFTPLNFASWLLSFFFFGSFFFVFCFFLTICSLDQLLCLPPFSDTSFFGVCRIHTRDWSRARRALIGKAAWIMRGWTAHGFPFSLFFLSVGPFSFPPFPFFFFYLIS